MALKDKEKSVDLYFTGIGAAYYPELGSNCAFFVHNDYLYMIDCGESTFKAMKERDELIQCKKIIIILTHYHSDHVGSLGSMVSYCYNILKKKVVIISKENTLLPFLSISGISDNMYEYKNGWLKNDNGLEIEFKEVKHADNMKCFALIISNDGIKTYFSGDSSEIPEDILKRFFDGEINNIYQDCTFVNKISKSHNSLSQIIEMVPIEYRNRFYCMHFGSDMFEEVRNNGFQIPDIVYSNSNKSKGKTNG